MKLTFHGGAGSVTGANYLLESGGTRILIDCGLHQGGHFAERKNFEDLPYPAESIQAVCITHAHIDHIGLLPKLKKSGFSGKIYSTPPTRDFAELLLLDSEHLLKEEAVREGKPPLYSSEDVAATMSVWEGLPYHQKFRIGDFEVAFYDAGHILGSAIIKVEAEGKSIVFSGDLGNSPAPIIKDTETMAGADYCVVESTYGDRVHEREDRREEELEDAVEDVVKSGGVLIVPAFAMERTQDLLYHLNELVEKGRIPRVPVFIDSPLAIKLTAVYKKYETYFDEDAYRLVKSGEDIFNFPGLHLTLTTEESKSINGVPPPKIVIAGSGMSTGGRILHHERRYLPDPKSLILFVGYQSAGSLGRQILDGARTVRIMGEEVPVRCARRMISAFSAHADRPRLIAWLRPFRLTAKKLFVVQGEPEASESLAAAVRDELAVETVVPEQGSKHVL